MKNDVQDVVLEILREHGPLETKDILERLTKQKLPVERKELNSLLYGALRNQVTKDVNAACVQVWNLSQQKFTATKGLEFTLYRELLHKKIITTENSQLDFAVTNRRNRKVYHLDIAVRQKVRKLNIEVDGFDHLRADAMYSIQKQLREKGKNSEIEIDWMDHERSFIDYKSIDTESIYQWCTRHAEWCRRYHEELIWPKDISRNLYLIENGWEIMRVWNYEVKHDLKRVVQEITDWMR
jgi:very-short-patch-repair endonuclease